MDATLPRLFFSCSGISRGFCLSQLRFTAASLRSRRPVRLSAGLGEPGLEWLLQVETEARGPKPLRGMRILREPDPVARRIAQSRFQAIDAIGR